MDGGFFIRDEYERVKRILKETRLSKIYNNVGSVPLNAPTLAAEEALKNILNTQLNIQRGFWNERGSSPAPAKPPKVKFSPCQPPPPGLSWVRVRTNLRSPEGFSDPSYYVPYLGDTDAHLKSSNSLYKDLTETNIEETDDTNSEGGRQDDSDVEELESTILPRAGQRVCTFGWERAAKRLTIKNLVEMTPDLDVNGLADSIARQLDMTEDHVVAYHSNAVRRARGWEKSDKEVTFKADCKKELVSAARSEVSDTAGTELTSDSLTMLFCRQCYSFDCMQHGLDTTHPKNDSPDATRVALLSEGDRNAVIDRCKLVDPGGCYVVATRQQNPSLSSPGALGVLSPSAKSLYIYYRDMFGDDPCRISEMIRIVDFAESSDLRCINVGVYASSLPACGSPKRPRHGGNNSKKNSRGGSVPHKEINAMHSGMRLDYIPCNHVGACNKTNCTCAKTGVNCEKYCTCNHVRVSGDSRSHSDGVCVRAFRGCNCKSAAACQSNQCVCVSHRRECDPDLCRSCGAGNAPGEPRGCCNAGLRLGLRYRTVVGRSSVHGWGVFPVVEIPKNVLVGEYLGEVITQEEAERRGRVYDELQYSFLFNITEMYAIDSTRMGSKLKYCNHSKDPNCEPRLMRVGGDVRVGIYSRKNIRVFEELFFDYGYGKTGPDWANKTAGKVKPAESSNAGGPRGNFGAARDAMNTDDEEDDDDGATIGAERPILQSFAPDSAGAARDPPPP